MQFNKIVRKQQVLRLELKRLFSQRNSNLKISRLSEQQGLRVMHFGRLRIFGYHLVEAFYRSSNVTGTKLAFHRCQFLLIGLIFCYMLLGVRIPGSRKTHRCKYTQANYTSINIHLMSFLLSLYNYKDGKKKENLNNSVLNKVKYGKSKDIVTKKRVLEVWLRV